MERREDPSDRRSIQVWLTAKGRQIANQAFVIAQDFNLHMSGNQDEEVLAKWEKQLSELEFRASQHLKAADELTE